jgi:phosphatidylinositol 3-kinase
MINNFFKEHEYIRAPWAPSEFIAHIGHTKRFASKTKPLCIDCINKKGETFKVLIKQEDVRTDRLAMDIAYWIESLTKDIHIHRYQVFPFDSMSGCVIMIPNASTLYDIRRKSTLLNHVLSCNPNMTVAKMRDNIVSSCVGACLLAFTMGLGDRHLENILVTQEGFLAHVDFGYVLGEDPKHIATPMRITEDMVEAIGGRSSSSFALFIERTQGAYEDMRLYASFWYHLLAAEFHIFGETSRHWKRIRDHILDRFVPGELDEEASLHIQTVVQQATNDSITQRMADFAHLASNQIMGGIFHMEL